MAGEAPGPFSLVGHMVRVYNGNFRHGGRYYVPGNSWQNAPGLTKPAPNRSHLLINGEPVIELDFSEFHPRMLYGEVGVCPPADCYAVGNWPRKLVKLALLVLVNAKSRSNAIGAIAYDDEMKKFGKVGREAMTEAVRLIADVKRVHKPIAHLFHTGAGLRLMRTDSDLTERVLATTILGKGIPTLCLHDGFMVPASKRADLAGAMDDAPGRLGLPKLPFKVA